MGALEEHPMQNVPPLELMKRAVRARVCPQCSQRPPGSESLGPHVPRSCEPECTIFVHLPAIRDIAAQTNRPSLGPYEHAVRELICQTCEASPTAGDFCDGRSTRSCPLSRYLGDVIETLEAVNQRHQTRPETAGADTSS